MLKIVYRSLIFQDASRDVISVQGALHQSLIADALSADECSIVVRYNPAALGYYINDTSHGSGFLYTVNGEIYMCRTTDEETITENMGPFEDDFVNAEPVDIYEDDTFFKRFYVTEALPIRLNRDGSVLIQLKAVSFIGLTVFMSHNGGIYSNSTVGAIMAEILKATKNETESTSTLYWYDMPNGLHYTMDYAVARVRADGHLPITDKTRTARDNIKDLCFAAGVSVLQQSDGSAYFTFNQPTDAIGVSDLDIYSGDAYSRRESVTEVKVIANTYQRYSGEDEIILWEGTNQVSHSKVLFDEPCWNLRSSQVAGEDTLTIEESGANYAIISGTGTLYGIPYLHTQEEFSQQIGTGVERVKTGECGMVTLLNYQNVLERMVNYYGKVREVAASIVVKDGASTGSLISFNDPLGRAKTGIISQMDFTMSGIIKGNLKVATNWIPSAVGNNYNDTEILTGSGTWSKAAAEAAAGHEITSLRIDLIGAGDGGGNGQAGQRGSMSAPGDGGKAGAGGNPGRVFTIVLEDDEIPDSFTYTCAAAAPGGQTGGATSVTINGTTYTSDAGTRPMAGYQNLINGELMAEPGNSGYDGVRGGSTSQPGENLTVGVTTFYGGSPGATRTELRYRLTWNGSQWIRTVSSPSTTMIMNGGAGGGAAYGIISGAGNGHQGYLSGVRSYYGIRTGVDYVVGGTAGDGVSAQAPAQRTMSIGSGGDGGHGGGGGGQGDASASGAGGYEYTQSATGETPVTGRNNPGSYGTGGDGSVGTAGGPGGINVYY